MGFKSFPFYLFFNILSYLFLLASSFQDDNFLDGQMSLIIEDSLVDSPSPSFVHRSTIHVRSVKSGNAVISHNREWTDEDTNLLKKLVENDGIYRIRLSQKGFSEKGYVSTFTKACLLYESGLTEILTMMVDGIDNSVVGIGLFTQIPYCEGKEDVLLPNNFNTSIIIRSPITSPVPDTATFIQKMEAMKNEKAEGKDNRSFLAKYWMYIIPVVLLLVISGGGQEGAAAGGR